MSTYRASPQRWLFRYAVLTAISTWCLICLGGLVTSHEAGLAVPDWPTTYGYNMFFFPISKWVGGVFYEHTHRLLASLVGFLTIFLAVWLWLSDSRRWLRWLGVAALALVILQGVLGGLRVTQLMAQLGIVHATLAQLFFVLVAAIALFTSRFWSRLGPMPGEPRTVRFWHWALAALILLQLVLGAAMRHQHAGLAIPDFPLAYGQAWPNLSSEAIAHYNQARLAAGNVQTVTAFQVGLQMFHRLLACLVFCSALYGMLTARAALGWSAPATRGSVILAGLVVVQFLLGAATIWTNKSADIATAHVGVGALLFAGSVVVAFIGPRQARAEVAQPEPSPVHPEPALGQSTLNSPA